MEFRPGGHPWGLNRVVKPKGVLPQSADRLEASLPIFDNEILVSVSKLQIDAASLRQLMGEIPSSPPLSNLSAGCVAEGGGGGFLAQKILAIVAERGKMHNPKTNSGGVFLGTVEAIGPGHPQAKELRIGDPVVSLVSLTLTPLSIKEIGMVDEKKGQISVSGSAIVFESGSVRKMPADLSEGAVLAAWDVCGGPAQVKRTVREGEKILIIGLGKAGKAMACMAEEVGALVYGVDADLSAVAWCQANIKGHFAALDATHPMEVYTWVNEMTRGALADVAVNSASIEGTEMSGVVSCRDGGKALFFGMRTSFQKTVLGAEGIGKDVLLLMGSGYVPGHAELMLNLLRNHKPLQKWFEEKFG
ncbi:MAG: L-erythro-3,5-diaminohexanoate dehydrogenase [Deltaproteobacteria bacterium]|nr:L-erythro-3,5-diaminohexanoate dehydrogenase [Deltaproteobacteria bacterium]